MRPSLIDSPCSAVIETGKISPLSKAVTVTADL